MYETARNMGAVQGSPERLACPATASSLAGAGKYSARTFFSPSLQNPKHSRTRLQSRLEAHQTNPIDAMASSKKVTKTSRDKKQPTTSKVAGGRIEKSKKTAAKRQNAPGPLLNLVQSFLSEHGYTEAASKLQAESEATATAAAPKDMPNLTTLYEQWEKTSKDAPDNMDVDKKSVASSDESSDSSSASDSDSSDDSSDSDDDEAPNKAAAKDIDSDSSSSSSDSDSESDSDSDTDSEDEQAKPKRAASVASSSASSSSSSSDSDSSSDDDDDAANVPLPESDDSSSSGSSSDSSDSSDSDSSSESESETEAKSKKFKVQHKKTKKAASVSSSSSSSSSSSDSSSDSDSSSSDSASNAAHVKKASKKAAAKGSDSSSSSSDSSSSESDSSDSETEEKESKSDSSRTVGPASPPAPVASDTKRKHAGSPEVDGQPKKKNHVENRFQRVKPDYYVDPKFASNEYVSYDYADRAHADLIVTKGKGFTKEKNKKKRGSYRGGMIDTSGGKGIKFDD